MQRDLIIAVGRRLSGKRTLAKKSSEFIPNVAVVCPDTIRLALHARLIGDLPVDLMDRFIKANYVTPFSASERWRGGDYTRATL